MFQRLCIHRGSSHATTNGQGKDSMIHIKHKTSQRTSTLRAHTLRAHSIRAHTYTLTHHSHARDSRMMHTPTETESATTHPTATHKQQAAATPSTTIECTLVCMTGLAWCGATTAMYAAKRPHHQ